MLSRSERARLAEMERQLEREDPELARRFSTGWEQWQLRWWPDRALLVLGFGGVLVGVLVASPAVLVGVGVVPLLVLLVRARRRRDGRGAADPDRID